MTLPLSQSDIAIIKYRLRFLSSLSAYFIVMLISFVLLFILFLTVTNNPNFTYGLICLILGLVCLAYVRNLKLTLKKLKADLKVQKKIALEARVDGIVTKGWRQRLIVIKGRKIEATPEQLRILKVNDYVLLTATLSSNILLSIEKTRS